MTNPRILLVTFFLVLASAGVLLISFGKRTNLIGTADHPKEYMLSVADPGKVKSMAAEARSFVLKKGYNTSICFLIDMSLPSGQNRFFVYDLKNDTVKNKGLVTHGRCNEDWLKGRKYGNTVGCGCSSLGKYKIGYSYTGRFGLAFKLFGLDATNNKAFDRFVVLHAHDCIPEREVTDDICQSDGCPTVSLHFLRYLKPVIKESAKPILLWIYE